MRSLKRHSTTGNLAQDWEGSTGDSGQGDLQDSSAEMSLGGQKPVRLLLVDSMPVVHTALQAALAGSRRMTLAGVTQDHDQVLALVKQTRPDVVILDILGRQSGSRSLRVHTDIVRKAHRIHAATQCVVFTHFHPRHVVETLLEEGALGVWSKFDAVPDLLDAVQKVGASHRPRLLSPTIQDILRSDNATEREAGWLALLTTREREVLKLVLEGEDSYRIGERLGISPRTVSTHRSRILQKTAARSFFELIGCLQQLEELGH